MTTCTSYIVTTTAARAHDSGHWTSHTRKRDAVRCAKQVAPSKLYMEEFNLDTGDEVRTKVAVYGTSGRRTWSINKKVKP